MYIIKHIQLSENSPEQATYAADNINADWNDQAVKQAKTFLEHVDYTDDELKELLKNSGFTEEEINYAIKNK